MVRSGPGAAGPPGHPKGHPYAYGPTTPTVHLNSGPPQPLHRTPAHPAPPVHAERGAPGGVALILLISGLAVRSRRICDRGALPPPSRAVVPRPELLAAAVLAVALSAMFYEVLHFRHVWALFGVVAALALSAHRRPELRS